VKAFLLYQILSLLLTVEVWQREHHDASTTGVVMFSNEQAKQMAKRLRASLAARDQAVPHSTALELVAQQLGYKDWNTASAMLPQETPQPTVTFDKPIPILRMFDEAKAREFYLDFLGFSVEFEHRFEADLPLYLGISRNGLQLHLSEHHGDASPGSTVFIPMQNIELLRDELLAKRYGYGRPDIVEQGWGQVLEVYDPFGNRLRFCQS
jgi:catechol 2,3-dioxygenase-like lactoylglutathione lyase family enzyme